MTQGRDLDWRRRGRKSPEPALPDKDASRLALADRVRIARGARQAVLRILSYRRGADGIRRTLAYIGGKSGERLVVEGDLDVEGKAARDAIVADWSRDLSTRSNGRDAVHLEVSAPPGSDRDRLYAAARLFAREVFGESRQYVLAEHRDTAHPHCHILVKLRGYDGRQLDPRKSDLHRWRSAFAAAARSNGLLLDASPRITRGAPPRGRSRAGIESARRGTATVSPARKPPDTAKAETLAQRLALEREAFHRAALRLAEVAERSGVSEDRERYRTMARDLVAFGDGLAPGQAAARAPRARGTPDIGRGD